MYSQVDVRNPCKCCFSYMEGVKMAVVDLKAGDLLYVPKHWWHFVECMETSVNVNLWCPLPSDEVSFLRIFYYAHQRTFILPKLNHLIDFAVKCSSKQVDRAKAL